MNFCCCLGRVRAKKPPKRTPTPLDFRHTPLRDPSSQIRLLEINEHDPLAFKISDYPLHSAPRFIAISYVWGNPTACKTISINGRRFNVTSNAEEAMRQTHIGAKSISISYIWLDSVCIDQTSLSEKGRQVGMMGDIYGTSHAVYAYIGGDADGAAELFQSIPQLLETGDPLDETTARAARAVAARPYWRRLWIVQELALAEKSPIILCGSAAAGLQSLKGIMVLFNIFNYGVAGAVMEMGTADWDHPQNGSVRGPALSPKDRTGKRPFDSTGLARLLRAFWPLGCADPRDRIFGLLGIIDWGTASNTIKVDYNNTRIQLACRAMQFMSSEGKIGMDDVLNLLAALHHNFIAPWGDFYLFWDYSSQDKFPTLIGDIESARHEDNPYFKNGEYWLNVRALQIISNDQETPTATGRTTSLVMDAISPTNGETRAKTYWRGIHVADVDKSTASGDYLLLGEDPETYHSFAFVFRYDVTTSRCRFLSTASVLNSGTLDMLKTHASREWKLDALSFLTLSAVTLWSRHLAAWGRLVRNHAHAATDAPSPTATDPRTSLPPLLMRAEITYESRYDNASDVFFAQQHYHVPSESDKIYQNFHTLLADQNFRKISNPQG
jgi:hypothetical protein